MINRIAFDKTIRASVYAIWFVNDIVCSVTRRNLRIYFNMISYDKPRADQNVRKKLFSLLWYTVTYLVKISRYKNALWPLDLNKRSIFHKEKKIIITIHFVEKFETFNRDTKDFRDFFFLVRLTRNVRVWRCIKFFTKNYNSFTN